MSAKKSLVIQWLIIEKCAVQKSCKDFLARKSGFGAKEELRSYVELHLLVAIIYNERGGERWGVTFHTNYRCLRGERVPSDDTCKVCS